MRIRIRIRIRIRNPATPHWSYQGAAVHETAYAPVIYTALCIMCWAYRLDAISQSPKNSRIPGSNPLPPVLRIRDVYPGSRILIFTHPGSKNSNKREGWKKIWCQTFLCSYKFHKILHYFSFEVLKKKIWANYQRIIELFAQKIVIKLSKVWVWYPGSGKNLFRIPDPGVKKAPDPDPQHCLPPPLIMDMHASKTLCTGLYKS